MDETQKMEEVKAQQENRNIEETKEKAVEAPVEPKKEEKKEPTPEEREKMEKQQQFFQYLKMGGTFLKWLLDDLKKTTQKNMNRASRRRIQNELSKGIISGELVQLYLNQVDRINEYFAETLAPKVQPQEVDGADFYKNAKEQEVKDGLNEKTN